MLAPCIVVHYHATPAYSKGAFSNGLEGEHPCSRYTPVNHPGGGGGGPARTAAEGAGAREAAGRGAEACVGFAAGRYYMQSATCLLWYLLTKPVR